MGDFTIYDTATGKIISAFSGLTEAERAETMSAGQSYIDGFYPPNEYDRIVDEQPVAVSMVIDAEMIARQRRDALLAVSDWTQVPDSPLSDADKTAWQTYRQALRDLPTHANWPDLQASDFPNKPD